MEYIYYIQENNKTSNPLTFDELKAKKIDENTFVWRKGIKDWVKAGELNELESIILFLPPPISEINDKVQHKNIDAKKAKSSISIIKIGGVEIEVEVINNFYVVIEGLRVFVDGNIAPDGKYKTAFLEYIYVENGIITKITMF